MMNNFYGCRIGFLKHVMRYDSKDSCELHLNMHSYTEERVNFNLVINVFI